MPFILPTGITAPPLPLTLPELDAARINPTDTSNEYESVMAVFFPHTQLRVMDYNRAVKDLNGLTPEEFIEKISSCFTVSKNFTARSPQQLHDFGMYLGGEWYKITIKKGMYNESDPVASLDAAILQEHLLYPVLGIKDPRVDDRIKFIGGIRGMDELEKLVNKDGFAVAFSLYPTTMEQIINVADAGAIMPPNQHGLSPNCAAVFLPTNWTKAEYCFNMEEETLDEILNGLLRVFQKKKDTGFLWTRFCLPILFL